MYVCMYVYLCECVLVCVCVGGWVGVVHTCSRMHTLG